MKLSVVMITLDEEGAVAKVINDIRNVAPNAEILLVDSSTDHTPEIAENLGARVIRQFPPRGYGRAMDLALRSASGETVVTLDCDNTYPVDAIPKLCALIEEGYDIVNASRLVTRPAAMPYANYIANRVFALTTRMLYGIRTTDIHSGMRAYRKNLIDDIAWNPDGPALPVELLIAPVRNGYRFAEIAIHYRERIGETTLHRLSSTWWTFKRIFGLRFRNRSGRPKSSHAEER